MAPPDDQGKRKTLVVRSGGSYCAYNIVDQSATMLSDSTTMNNYHTVDKGHIALATNHPNMTGWDFGVRNNRVLSVVINDKILRLKYNNDCSDQSIIEAVRYGLSQY